MTAEQFNNGAFFIVTSVHIDSGKVYVKEGGSVCRVDPNEEETVYVGALDGITDKGFNWYSFVLGKRVGHYVAFKNCIVTNK